MKYSLNQKVWEIKITNAVEEKSYRKNGIQIDELEIIGISKFKICINDDWFKSFNLPKESGKKESYESYLDDVNVSIYTGNNILGDGIYITLYSTKEPNKKLLDKMATKASLEIDKRYGFLFNGVKNKIYDMVDSYEF